MDDDDDGGRVLILPAAHLTRGTNENRAVGTSVRRQGRIWIWVG